MLNFMMPKIFQQANDFEEWFNFGSTTQGSQIHEDAKYLVIQILHRILKPFMLRRTKAERAAKLPTKHEINISLSLSPLQIKLYSELLTNDLNISSLVRGDANVSFKNRLMQLRKTCNHPYLFPGVEPEDSAEFGDHLITNSGKMIFLDKLVEKVKAQGDQMIIFSNFTTMLSIVEDYCELKQVPYCRLDGATDLEDREEQIEDFTSPGSDKIMFLVSTRAGGLGINLYTANHVVLFDSDFNP